METEKRLIDANALIKDWNELTKRMVRDTDGKIPVDFGLVIRELSKSPKVDAVEVVRCKDCIHHKLPAVLTQKYGEPGTLTCRNWHSPCNKRNVKQDDFCSYGERKDND